MEIVHRCCCGLDVHKQTVVACLRRVGADGRRSKELRTFGTMTDDLLALADWLRVAGCTQVAMESTGSTGSQSQPAGGPVRVLVVNAQHQGRAGRDGPEGRGWIADLLPARAAARGFIPDRPQRGCATDPRAPRSATSARPWSTGSEGGGCQHQARRGRQQRRGAVGARDARRAADGMTDPTALAGWPWASCARARHAGARTQRALRRPHRLLLTTHLAHRLPR